MGKKNQFGELEIGLEFDMEWDERGFSVICNILENKEHFGEHLIPSMLIHYVRQLCKEQGLSFEQVLRTSMGLPATTYKDKVLA